MRAPKKKPPSNNELWMATKGFRPTGWWKAVDSDGRILAESTDPQDWVFRKLLKKEGVIILRIYQKVIFEEVVESPDE